MLIQSLILVFAVCLLGAAAMPALSSGEILTSDSFIESATGQYRLTIDPTGALALRLMKVKLVDTLTGTIPVNGNTVHWDKQPREPVGVLWYVPAVGDGANHSLRLQSDGNLVRYEIAAENVNGMYMTTICNGQPTVRATWSSKTDGKAFGSMKLVVRDANCDIVLLNENSGVTWSAQAVKAYSCTPRANVTPNVDEDQDIVRTIYLALAILLGAVGFLYLFLNEKKKKQ